MRRGAEVSLGLVVVPLDEMDGLASQPLSILRHVSGAAKAKVSEEVERIARLHTGIHTLHNRFVHLMRIGERALAETNDVGVSQMKVGREPNVSHHSYYLRNRPTLCLTTSARPLMRRGP